MLSPDGDEKHAAAALGIIRKLARKKSDGMVHPDEWEEAAMTHGLSPGSFKTGKRRLEKEGRVAYLMGGRYEDSYYYLKEPPTDA